MSIISRFASVVNSSLLEIISKKEISSSGRNIRIAIAEYYFQWNNRRQCATKKKRSRNYCFSVPTRKKFKLLGFHFWIVLVPRVYGIEVTGEWWTGIG
jgi:hypothetical protein